MHDTGISMYENMAAVHARLLFNTSANRIAVVPPSWWRNCSANKWFAMVVDFLVGTCHNLVRDPRLVGLYIQWAIHKLNPKDGRHCKPHTFLIGYGPGDGSGTNDEIVDPIFLLLSSCCWNGISMGCVDLAKKHVTSKGHADVGLRVCDYPTIQVSHKARNGKDGSKHHSPG